MASGEEDLPKAETKRLAPKKQTLDDAYAPPSNFLEIDVSNPETHGFGRNRYTDYEIRMRVRANCRLFVLSAYGLFICLFMCVCVLNWYELLQVGVNF